MIGRLRFLAGITTLGAWLVTAAPAAASCAEPPPIEEHLATAGAIFVGTVHEVTNESRTARVEVHEIWVGPDLPAAVTVHGGPEEPGMATSVDRHFEAGVRYLFAVSAHDGRLEDNACTATQPWTDGLAQLRPDVPRSPLPAAEGDTGSLPTPLLVALTGVAAVALAGILAFRRRA
jgi:hypothetical protein